MFKRFDTKTVTTGQIVFIFLLCASFALAHPISFSKAEADVLKDKVTVRLSVACEDLFLFHGLEPDDQNMLRPDVLSAAIEKHKSFLLKYVSIVDKDGQRLAGEVTQVKSFEIPPEGVSVGDMMKYSITYDLAYPLAEPLEFLTFVQDFGGEETFVPSVMDLSIRQGGVEIDYVTQLGKGQAHTLRFDWSNPPTPLTADQRQHREQQRLQNEAAMGISSYGSIYSFIYIERFEVRHEILIPLLTLETFLPIKRENKNFLEIDEQDAVHQAIGELFSERNPVRIDGIEVKPVVSRIDFYGLDFKDFAMMAPRKRLSVMNARVGIILSYSTKGSLGQLEMDWELFNPNASILRSTIFTDSKTEKFVFSRYRRQFSWSNPDQSELPVLKAVPCPAPPPAISLPWLSLLSLIGIVFVIVLLVTKKLKRIGLAALAVLAAITLSAWTAVRVEVNNPFAPVPELTNEQADTVFTALHKNIYRAFDYRDESDIYDALAHSVGGDLLSQLYLIIHQGRLMAEQGGAVSRIQEVNILSGQKERVFRTDENQAAFSYRARWTVLGTVEHWGHIHERTHEYEARFEVQAQSDAWRITDFEVLDEKRLKYKVRLRKF